MIPLCFQTADLLSSQTARPQLHVAHDGPVHSWERQEEYSGVEYNVPFREESCRSSCNYSGPLHSYSRDAVSQHLSTRAGAESIQLIYSGRALQALSDLARQFRCHPIFWWEFVFVESHRKFWKLQSHAQKDVLVLMLPTQKRFASKVPTENRNCLSLPALKKYPQMSEKGLGIPIYKIKPGRNEILSWKT